MGDGKVRGLVGARQEFSAGLTVVGGMLLFDLEASDNLAALFADTFRRFSSINFNRASVGGIIKSNKDRYCFQNISVDTATEQRTLPNFSNKVL